MTRRSFMLAAVLLGVVVTAVTALGIGVRATYGAQTTADEPQYLLSALSLWEDGDLDISDELDRGAYLPFHEIEPPRQTLERPDGTRISPHDPLLPLLLAVPMGLGGWVAAKGTLAALAGVLAALTAWVAHRRLGASPATALAVVGCFALSIPLATYATQVYPEIPAALATLAGVAALLGTFGRRGRALLVVAVVALPWLAVKYVPVAAVLAVAGLVRLRGERRRQLWLAAVLAGAGVVYVLGHLAIYGGLTPYAAGDHFVGGELTAVGTEVDLLGRSTRLLGLVIDGGFGIGAWQPAFLLLPLGVGWLAARRSPAWGTLGAVVAAGWLVATFVALTMHGWWSPGRQVVVVVPVLVLAVAVWADGLRSRMTAVVTTGVLGVAAFVALLVEGLQGRLTWVVDFGSTANPLYQALAWSLPDYRVADSATWIRHAVWLAVAGGLLVAGAYRGRRMPPAASPPEMEISNDDNQRERVSV